MNIVSFYKYGFIISLAMLIALALFSISISGPGDNEDPVVSLSYLQLSSKYGEVPLRQNDEYPVDAGSTFILTDGKAELRGVGDYYVIDLTIGKSFKRGKNLTKNHLYVVTGGSDIEIVAKDDVSLLIKGADGGPLRRAY